MNRTIALLIVFALCGLFAAANSLAQVFAQSAAPATPPPAVAPRPVGPPELPGAPGAPPARVGVVHGNATLAAPATGGGGGFIRAAGPGGAGNFVFQGPDWAASAAGIGFVTEDDPEMAKLVQTEHELARQSDDLVRQYGETEDYAAREKLRGQLRELLVKQFEAQQQRREREQPRATGSGRRGAQGGWDSMHVARGRRPPWRPLSVRGKTVCASARRRSRPR